LIEEAGGQVRVMVRLIHEVYGWILIGRILVVAILLETSDILTLRMFT
jgi:hypothetical protein